MPDSTLEGLPANGTLAGTDSIYLVQPGGSRELTLADLAAWVKTAESIVPASLPHRGARVKRTTDLTSVTFPIILTWQAEDFDTDGFWSDTDPTKLIIPAGVSKVRFTGQIAFEEMTVAGALFASIRKNSTGTDSTKLIGLGTDAPRMGGTGFAVNNVPLFSGVMDVVPGDYFDVRVNAANMSGQDQILASTDSTWFEIEVVETN